MAIPALARPTRIWSPVIRLDFVAHSIGSRARKYMSTKPDDCPDINKVLGLTMLIGAIFGLRALFWGGRGVAAAALLVVLGLGLALLWKGSQ